MPAKLKTPLRYPGGKSKLKNYTMDLIELNNFNGCTYIEAFAGGAGLAMELLFNETVGRVILNDIDRSIYALWYCVLNNTEMLIEIINTTDITIDEWYIQKDIQNNKSTADLLQLAYSTLFLNRTNRSGILTAGPIGGKKQNGNYTLDCRFNKVDIVQRIREIASRSELIEFHNMDALDFIDYIDNHQSQNSFIFFDPPYYDKGPELYVNHYIGDDHHELSERISELDIPWIVTYDNSDYIRELYDDYNQTIYYLNYSAQKPHKGQELMIYSNNINPAPLNRAY